MLALLQTFEEWLDHPKSRLHLIHLKEHIAETERARKECEVEKIAAEEDIEAINKWNFKIESKINEADSNVRELKASLDIIKDETTQKKEEKELEFQRKLFET